MGYRPPRWCLVFQVTLRRGASAYESLACDTVIGCERDVLGAKNWVARMAYGCLTRHLHARELGPAPLAPPLSGCIKKGGQASEGSACHRVGLAGGRTELRMLGKNYVGSMTQACAPQPRHYDPSRQRWVARATVLGIGAAAFDGQGVGEVDLSEGVNSNRRAR